MSSEKVYNQHWLSFSEFMTTTLKRPALPAKSYDICLYVTHLHSLHLKASTIRNHLSAIAFAHKINDHQDPTENFKLRKLLDALKRIPSASLDNDRRPIRLKLLSKILKNVKWVVHSHYDRKLYQAVFCIMYHAGLRASEVAVSDQSQHTLQFANVSLDDNRLFLTLTSFKHSKQKNAKMVLLANKSRHCPVRAAKAYLRVRKPHGTHFFLTHKQKGISRQNIAKVLKKVLSHLSLNPNHYNTHSFRSGKITDLAMTGTSFPNLKSAGRFNSDAYMQYIKPSHITMSWVSTMYHTFTPIFCLSYSLLPHFVLPNLSSTATMTPKIFLPYISLDIYRP